MSLQTEVLQAARKVHQIESRSHTKIRVSPELELQGVAAIPAGVEFFARGERDS
jgi:hypothetical protein